MLFWGLSLGVFIYKGMPGTHSTGCVLATGVPNRIHIAAGWHLPYKKGTFDTELSLFCLFAVVNFPRLLLGSSGNKAEKLTHIIGMLALSAVAVMFHSYFIALQVFVYVISLTWKLDRSSDA